jgi:hypothetical protein
LKPNNQQPIADNKKNPSLNGKPGSVNQGASTIPFSWRLKLISGKFWGNFCYFKGSVLNRVYSLPKKKNPSLTSKPGSVNQGASTIPFSWIIYSTSGKFWGNFCYFKGSVLNRVYSLPKKKNPSLTSKPGSVNQGASTIPFSWRLKLISGKFWGNFCYFKGSVLNRVYSLPKKKNPSLTSKPGNVNQGASTIPFSWIIYLTSGKFWGNFC